MMGDPEVAFTDLQSPKHPRKRPDWMFKNREGWIIEGNNAALMGMEPPLPSDLIKSDPF